MLASELESECDWPNNPGTIDVKMNGSFLEKYYRLR